MDVHSLMARNVAGFKPILSQAGYSAVIWVEVVVAVIFVALRTFVQFQSAKRFFINDYFIFLAVACHIGAVIVCQIAIPTMYELEQLKIILKTGGIPPANAIQQSDLFLRLQFALLILLWTTLWSVKFSLLFFFWRLFDSVRTLARVFWWIMFFITASTFITTIFMQLFACGRPGNFFNLGGCQGNRDIYLSNLVFQFSAGTDIAGDVFILLIPFPLLWKLRVDARRKRILVAVFLLPLIPILFGILRLVYCNPTLGPVDVIKFQFYSLLENSAAIVTSCLPSLRLFADSARGTTKASYPYYAQNSGLQSPPRTFRDQHNGSIPLESVLSSHKGEVIDTGVISTAYSERSDTEMLREGLSGKKIMVSREYSVARY